MEDVEMAEAATAPAEFVLSRVLIGHKGEVKSVATTSQGMILSGGRDETVRMWIGRGGDFSENNALPQSPKGAIVYSIAYFESDEGWRIFVGRKDGAIAVYCSGSGDEPLITLKHHSSVVCCLHVDTVKGKLLSGSWDNHIIIWPIEELTPGNEVIAALMCEGHTMSVWAVHSLNRSDEFHFLSASADQSVRLWHNDTCLKVFRGHTDVVRSLVLLDSAHFISAANDGSLVLWNLERDEPLAKERAPHDEFIYSMARVGADTVVTCGEGGHVVVWRVEGAAEGGTRGRGFIHQTQVTQTPVSSLWSVAALKNGDFVLASSDGRIFIYTREEARMAPVDIREHLDAELSARLAAMLQQQQERESDTVTIKVAIDDGNANMELKYVKGTDPSLAAEKFITDNNLPISYLSEITDYIKANIPEAAAFAAKKRKVVQHGGDSGKMSFSVLVEDGRQLTCSFGPNDDPDQVAQEFVEQYNLQIKYLASTAQLVRKEQAQSTSVFYDPFTGGGRYVPGGSGGIGGEEGGDPLTGGGRYIPGSANGGGGGGTGGDPLTSGGRYVPGSANTDLVPNACLPIDKKRPRGELCPLKNFYVFGAEHFSQKAYDRLVEGNEKSVEAVRLREDQLLLLRELAVAGPKAVKDEQLLVDTLNVGLEWAVDELLPILDLFRIAILNEDVNRYYTQGDRSTAIRERLFALLVSDTNENLKAIVCRALCNLFHHKSGRKMLAGEMNSFLPVIGMLILSPKPVLQTAASSALSNWAYLLLLESESGCEQLGPREDGIREIVKALEAHLSFGGYREDGLTRVLQAISTLMWGDVSVIKLAKSRKIVDIVNRIKDALVDETGKSLCRDIVEMTYAV